MFLQYLALCPYHIDKLTSVMSNVAPDVCWISRSAAEELHQRHRNVSEGWTRDTEASPLPDESICSAWSLVRSCVLF